MNWRGWGSWKKLCELSPQDIPNSPGAYVIATGKSLNRFVGRDSEGILDVGESGNLRRRLRFFKRCAAGKSKNHSAGCRYFEFKLSKKFPMTCLRVRLKKTTSKEQAKQLEARFMRVYVAKHFELPPLNSSFNRKYK